MKRSILTLGMLALGFLTKAQTNDLTYVGNGAEMTISPEVIYSVIDGKMTIVGTGKITNSGNVMIINGSGYNAGFRTITTAGLPKTNGGNFILKIYDTNLSNLRYGQLYFEDNPSQTEVTGVVDKEYKDNHHGSYQQITLPFKDKKLSELSAELLSSGHTFKFGAGNRANRYSGEAIMKYSNEYARFDDLSATSSSDDDLSASVFRYYILGTKNFNASAAVKTIKGVPLSGDLNTGFTIGGLLSPDVVFGTGGKNQNFYRERYNTYIQDQWHMANFGPGSQWTGDFGKNIVMYGNYFLTNLDIINQLPTWTNNDILGIRLEPTSVTTASGGGTQSAGAKNVTYSAGGTPSGDVGLVIKPMQTFALKFRNYNAQSLYFDKGRRFAYTARPYLASPSVLSRGSAGSLKQLGVIALDEHGNELGRTYYVVYPEAQTGKPATYSTQVAAGGENIIGTFEEKPTGGIDEELQNSYWLYINEANQSDFKGKEIPLKIYSDKVRALKFEVRENAVEVPDSQEKFRNGQSFYISKGKDLVTVGHNKTIPISASDNSFGLFYGKPSGYNDVSSAGNVAKPSATVVAFDEATKEYKIFFDPAWNTAKVEVYDLSGRLIYSKDKVDAKAGEFTLSLPSGNRATYVVKAVSETGSVFSQKIIK